MKIEFKDQIVKRKIGKKVLRMPESHQLPFYYSKFPLYDRALPRICKEVAKIDRHLTFVDVGANIGDTVSLITDEVQGSFLCIDGDKKYIPLLKMNTAKIKGSKICIEECYCSEDKNTEGFKIERYEGTAKLTMSQEKETQKPPEFKSLDEIIDKYKLFQKSNILKIDTDGFEISVLKGGKIFLNSAAPIIYFEFVPELYLNNKQDPMYIFELLKEKGYKEALFYDNFGLPIEIVKITKERRIKELIDSIDDNQLYYYDILTWHNSDRKKYKEIIKNELMVSKNEV